MSLEIDILSVLLSCYERSKVSKGQNKVHKDIKLDISHSVFDKHRNNDNGELDIAIQRIERQGYAVASYTRNGQFQCLILNLDKDSIDKLYKYLKKPNPTTLIETYKEIFVHKQNNCQIIRDFSKRMLELLEEKRLSTVQQYASNPDCNSGFLTHLDECITLRSGNHAGAGGYGAVPCKIPALICKIMTCI